MDIHGGNKFLTFLIGDEVYGIPIRKAKEIIGMMEITPIPKTQTYLKGVINLRGKIIPIIDLRLKFGMEEKMYTDRTCIIIVEADTAESLRLVGVAVDSVSEVIKIQESEIEPPPEYDAKVEGDFITSLAKLKDKIIMILDIVKILNREELTNIKEMAGMLQKNESSQEAG